MSNPPKTKEPRLAQVAPLKPDEPRADAQRPQTASGVAMGRRRPRHLIVAGSFLLFVVVPVILTGLYLYTRAVDRYQSQAGFSIRTEEISSAIELLGGVADLSGSSSSDTEIMYEYMQSQELVRAVDRQLDLRAIWAKGDPARDPVFAYHPPGTIEDLTDYWSRMVDIYSEQGTGLINVSVQAFTPEDAQRIAATIYEESSNMINRLSAIAREDAIRYAREELNEAIEQVKVARETLTRFRNRTQIVDPTSSLESQLGILNSLQAQLAATLVELDVMRETTREGDPRLEQAERRVAVIERRIEEERRKLGIGQGAAGEADAENAFATLVGEYERLLVDQEFAEQSYTSARATYDSALAEARRKSRYLAAHIQPTLAERAEYPQRGLLLAFAALFLFLGWCICVLVAYSIKDRR